MQGGASSRVFCIFCIFCIVDMNTVVKGTGKDVKLRHSILMLTEISLPYCFSAQCNTSALHVTVLRYHGMYFRYLGTLPYVALKDQALLGRRERNAGQGIPATRQSRGAACCVLRGRKRWRATPVPDPLAALSGIPGQRAKPWERQGLGRRWTREKRRTNGRSVLCLQTKRKALTHETALKKPKS